MNKNQAKCAHAQYVNYGFTNDESWEAEVQINTISESHANISRWENELNLKDKIKIMERSIIKDGMFIIELGAAQIRGVLGMEYLKELEDIIKMTWGKGL